MRPVNGPATGFFGFAQEGSGRVVSGLFSIYVIVLALDDLFVLEYGRK